MKLESSDMQTQSGLPASSPYVLAPSIPTQTATDGILFDYCDGLRVKFPEYGGPWLLRVEEEESGLVSFQGVCRAGAYMATRKKWFCKHKFTVWKINEGEDSQCPSEEPLFSHTFNAEGKNVLIQMAVGTLGDSIAWLGPAIRFAEQHHCKLTVSVNVAIKRLFASAYPDIHFITKDECADLQPYASYRLGLFFGDEENDLEPSDFRLTGLHYAAAHILGVPESEEPPRLLVDQERPIEEPYVCIAAKASMQCKFWNHPSGWPTVIEFLKKHGYRVLCIDRERDGGGVVPNPMPRGCEDFTGDRPLEERVQYLQHADFFIGLSSGLSWLAWACRIPVVLIGGFSEPLTEFQTLYRVLSPHACHGCWNDRRYKFDHKDFMWCPRHKGTDRQFECSRLITPEQVIKTIATIPTFRALSEE